MFIIVIVISLEHCTMPQFVQVQVLVLYALTFKVLSSSTPAYLNDLIQSAVPVGPLRSSDAPMLSAARTRTEFAQRAFSVAAPHTWNSLPSDIRSCHTLHTFKNTSKHTCLDSLSLKPPAPLYPLQDFKALYKYYYYYYYYSIFRKV